ncbi:MAG: PLP-dependent lyase/thiolase [archaeon]|nr:PLP-dependent lyase/thiolase [Nanoarchaeota archaeon]
MVLNEKERKVLYSIRVASENDPAKPEFPPDDPKFPATPTYKISIPGFKEVWLKDESHNPTGTHKDRMAWEMVVTYKDFLLAKKNDQVKEKLPRLSIITSGSAGIAIQSMLSKYKLPALKCLVDLNLNENIVHELERLGCEIYMVDLSRKPLDWKDILELTDNANGIDVTSSEGLDPGTRYYDWLSYEVINQSPDYCFIPFGSGHLFKNILNINKKEVATTNHDPRFTGDVKILKNCNFIGATVNDPKSKADKLYAPHRPFTYFDEQWLRVYKSAGYCGQESMVYLLREKYLNEALQIAKEQKINCEPSGIAGLGMLLQMKDKIPKNKKIMIVSTGKSKCKLCR